MNMREMAIAAVRRDPDLVPRVTEALRTKIEEERGPMATVVQVAEALEPILAEAVEKRPSRLGKLGLKSAHLLATLASEDQRSNRALAAIADNGTVGIVFVDVADFLAYTAEHGDEQAIELVTELESRIRKEIGPFRGELVKSLGDGFLLAFPSASQAVRAATCIRDAVRRSRRAPLADVKVRIAVHAGEPLVEQDDLLGLDVNLTARLLDQCRPGEIVVSDAARELAERRLRKIGFGNRRTVKIKGLATPAVIHSVEPG